MDGQSRECALELNDNCEPLVSSSADHDSHDALQMEEDFPVVDGFGILKDYTVDVPKPKVGMVFQSDSEAYEFYNRYARSMGFRVRKTSTTLRANRTISRRIFVCSKEGFRRLHQRGPSLKTRPPTRVDCKARIVTKLQPDGTYRIKEFVKEHNHELEHRSEAHTSKLKHNIQVSQAEGMDIGHSAGMVPGSSHSYLGTEVEGFPNLNSTHMDFTDCSHRRLNKFLEKGDAQYLLDYLQRMQKGNPNFYYSVRMDGNNQLVSCFWCDTKSMIDYSYFGDVVCFDTMYKTNDYEKPYAPFIGVNNHGHLILFGCALLLDETLESLTWLFQNFLAAMSGKQPKAIFTDRTMPIAQAIRQVFPNTHHRLCLWHIYQDAIKHLTDVFEQSIAFAKDFKKCIYDSEVEDEFQSNWETLLTKYNLVENQWLQDLYKICETWAPAYGRDHFCAGMTTIQRSEDMNKFLKKHLKRFLPLKEFVTQYEGAVTSRREKEKRQDSISLNKKPDLRTSWPAESRAADKYTRNMFTLFQDEYVGTLDLLIEVAGEDGSLYTYKVTSFEGIRPRTVTYDSSNSVIKCNCKKFEFTGVLCAHALKVLHTRRLLDLPSQYYLKRWTKDAKIGVVVDDRGGGGGGGGEPARADAPSSFGSRRDELAYMASTLAERAASTEESTTFARLILMQALGEVDSLLKTESRSVNHDNMVKESAANHSAASHDNLDKQNVAGKSVPRKTSRKGKDQPTLTGSQVSVSVVGTGTVSQPPMASGIPGIPLYPTIPWNISHYSQAMQSQPGMNVTRGLVSNGRNASPSWHGGIVPVNVVRGPGIPHFFGANFPPTGPLSTSSLPCVQNISTEGSSKSSEGATSHQGTDSTQSSQAGTHRKL